MILEIAELHIKADQLEHFKSAVVSAVENTICRAEGFVDYTLKQSVESPNRFMLMINWISIEAHESNFRRTPLMQQWRAAIGGFFEKPPLVEHFTPVGRN